MEILGYGLAVVMGLVLGVLGGGGSILTVPILVYILGVDEAVAPSYSLFVVGAAAIAGVIKFFAMGQVSLKTGILFAIPSTIAVYVVQRYIRPALPDVLFTIGDMEFSQGMGLMILFAIMMLATSISMIRGRKQVEPSADEIEYNYPLILLEGLGVGMLTGFVGAGGGFMIVPALVMLSKLPMKLAVGTSLLVIAIKSLIGFVGTMRAGDIAIDWTMLLVFTGLAVVGILIGSVLSKSIPGEKLKPAFGWFVLIMGIFVVTKTLWNG